MNFLHKHKRGTLKIVIRWYVNLEPSRVDKKDKGFTSFEKTPTLVFLSVPFPTKVTKPYRKLDQKS